MTLRAIRPDDTKLVKPMLQLGYPNVDWTEESAREFLAYEGVHVFDPDNLTYLLLTVNPNLESDLGFPTGLCTQVSALLPQHHDQKWVDGKLMPLLAKGLPEIARERPDLLPRPIYAFLALTLLPYWTGIFNAETRVRSSGSGVIWVKTLREAIAKVARL